MTSIDKNRKIRFVYLVIVATITFVMLTYVFYNQATTTDKTVFTSDLQTHIKYAINGKGYSFLYIVINLIYGVTGSMFSIAMFECLLVMFTWMASAKLISMMVPKMHIIDAAIIALPLTFLTGIYIPVFFERFYSRQLITQPYHNITYYGMRMFAVMAMVAFKNTFDHYLERISLRDWILIATFLALSTSVKPSFFYGFALALLVFLIIDFCKYGFRWKQFRQMLIMGTTVFPSLFIMATQALILYSKPIEDGGSGIAIVWGANILKHGLKVNFFRFVCGLSFPALVTLMSYKKFDRFDKFMLLLFVVEFSIAFMFGETGRRAQHGNFFWGVYIGAYFLFMMCLTHFLKGCSGESDKERYYRVVGYGLLSAHLISGILYFMKIFNGGHY